MSDDPPTWGWAMQRLRKGMWLDVNRFTSEALAQQAWRDLKVDLSKLKPEERATLRLVKILEEA